MKEDPIVEEARQAGQAYVESFDGKLPAVVADLQRRTASARELGRQIISRPPAFPSKFSGKMQTF